MIDERPGALRIWVHALDRTGPPMLALSFAAWVRRHHPGRPIETVAFRGGPLEADAGQLGPVTVVLDHHEPWDVHAPDAVLVAQRAQRLAHLAPAWCNLLVSVAAAQALPLAPERLGPVATWSVEIGEDLHWLDDPVQLHERTDLWLAGSAATGSELDARLGGAAPEVVPEFIDPVSVDLAAVADARHEVGVGADTFLVLGAGIGTHRKGIDLFLEAAQLHAARSDLDSRFVWFGGEDDPLAPLVAREAERRSDAQVVVRPAVPDLDRWLAAADVLLHPARFDAFPLVCLHAAAQATPTVGFLGVGGLTEMFGPTTSGARYPDLSALVDRLVELEVPEVRHQVGAAQRDHIASRFVAEAAGPGLFDRLAALADAGGVQR